jgi:hypothetical protein
MYRGQFIMTNATININEGTGFAHAVGSNTCLRGLHIINIQNLTQYFPSGRVIVSGIKRGLYVLESSFPTASPSTNPFASPTAPTLQPTTYTPATSKPTTEKPSTKSTPSSSLSSQPITSIPT